MKEYIKLIEKNVELTHALIKEIVLLEKQIIDTRYNEEDFFNNYMQIATIVDKRLEKIIYNYAVKLNIFIDLYRDKRYFLKNTKHKDYKALFISQKLLDDEDIQQKIKEGLQVYCIAEIQKENHPSVTFVDINKRSEYLKALSDLKHQIAQQNKKHFYLEIIKHNHGVKFTNYLDLKEEYNRLNGGTIGKEKK